MAFSNAYDCRFTENNATKYGGAIYASNVTNCTFTGNNADVGGVIYKGNATNCTFTGNQVTGFGGAIANGTAYNCKFTQNDANYGGAIYDGNVYNCTFDENYAAFNGGVIYLGNAYNCIFSKNKAWYDGGAIYNGSAYNCTFTGNNATTGDGGAIYNGSAYNCTFAGNYAQYDGGAMWKGNACLCNFNGDTTYETNIIPAIINVLNYTSTYRSEERLKFNLTADNILLDGINTTIRIYQNDSLITTVYGLTGEGWVVDLIPGEYTAVLSLTDYPDEQSVNATIKVLKGNTTLVIDPISDVKVGQEVIINYTTNSNGTVTIKVNGQEISGNTFTPTNEGIYNVTVEVTGNDYYTAASNETRFKAKLASKITASPVTTIYNVGKNLIITLKDETGKPIKNAVLTVNLDGAKKYTTDAKGQIKINVGTLTPKTYTAKISYAGSDIIIGSTASVKVTVKKATPKITAKRASYKVKVRTKKYSAIFKDNKNKAIKSTKVSLKVNGKNYITKTNGKGQAVFKITNLRKKGTYTGVITFPANKYYNKVSKKIRISVRN